MRCLPMFMPASATSCLLTNLAAGNIPYEFPQSGQIISSRINEKIVGTSFSWRFSKHSMCRLCSLGPGLLLLLIGDTSLKQCLCRKVKVKQKTKQNQHY
ncbi:hypothetical protein CHARACLAT_021302 [Characodon lateralis]|uniref:Secreted protein n=1 Tax=Characodon lateralis TaxID=208331 RepID=A0ABU7CZI8_9TELE|nr:hypothetical protein [Characodon lateralis]